MQMVQMRALYGRCREALRRMGEKASGCLQKREQMRQQMEEALQAKAAVCAHFPGGWRFEAPQHYTWLLEEKKKTPGL